jgi:hypothetical protein
MHIEARRLEADDMTADTDIAALCREALEQESGWRGMGAEGRKAAYDRFQHLLHEIAGRTGRTYEDVLNDAVEEWLTLHFCAIPTESQPSVEWRAAGHVDPQVDAQR